MTAAKHSIIRLSGNGLQADKNYEFRLKAELRTRLQFKRLESMDSETFSIENKDLIARAESGDEAALAELFAMAKPRLRKIVSVRMSPMLRGRVDPSDVLQEAFLDLNKNEEPDLEAAADEFPVFRFLC